MVKKKNVDTKEQINDIANSMKLFIIECKNGMQKFDNELNKVFSNMVDKNAGSLFQPIDLVSKPNPKPKHRIISNRREIKYVRRKPNQKATTKK